MWLKISSLALLPLFAAAQQPTARFHHIHLNSTEPAAAIAFYTSKFQAERRIFAGADAVFANNVWLLFNKVAAPPKSQITSGIWHIGWGGGADMKETYRKQLTSGTVFQTPLTDISDQCDGKGGNERFFFAYVDGPDHALIELNTTAAGNFAFGHLHLLSDDPIAAGGWYVKHFGLTRRGAGPISPEPRYRCGRQTAPAVSMMMNAVNVIVYPIGYAEAAFPEVWKGRQGIEATTGHVIDHIGFAVDSVPATLNMLRRDGVLVVQGIREVDGIRTATVQGPDRVRIELLEIP